MIFIRKGVNDKNVLDYKGYDVDISNVSLDAVLTSWETYITTIIQANVVLLEKLVTAEYGIEDNIDVKKFLQNKYGSQVLDNEEFTIILKLINGKFSNQRLPIPSFGDWFIDRFPGVDITQVDIHFI